MPSPLLVRAGLASDETAFMRASLRKAARALLCPREGENFAVRRSKKRYMTGVV